MATHTSPRSRGLANWASTVAWTRAWAVVPLLALLASLSNCATLSNTVSFDAAPMVVSLHFDS